MGEILSKGSVEGAGPEGLMLLFLAYLGNEKHDPFQDVTDFHVKYGIAYAGPPKKTLDEKLKKFRHARLHEEMKEYDEAYTNEDPVAKFDALVDLIYIALGEIHLHGWDFNEAWRRVHEKNMQKRLAGKGEGKYGGSGIDIVKPEGWTPPDLSDLVGK